MGKMKYYTQEEMEDRYIGIKGTPKRDAYEAEVNAFLVGEALKEARKAKNLTQEDLGKLMGVQKAQVSKIENGKELKFTTIVRAFKALGVPSATLDLGQLGKVALW